jgi:hypothetical protein
VCDITDRHPLDDQLRLDHLQVRGSHNSYHVEPSYVFHASHAYTQAPLQTQLEDQGVRTFELDVHRDGQGHRVYHILLADHETTCNTFLDCLRAIRRWSDCHLDHLPVVIWMEAKDDTGGDPLHLHVTDGHIRSVFPGNAIITPDEIQGSYPSIHTALAAEGWPTLSQLRGRFLFALIDGGAHRDAYTQGMTTLAGRPMFVRVEPGDFDHPLAAIAKLGATNDADIAAAHAAGLFIAANICNADETDAQCQADLASGIANGVHMLKDDFPAPVVSRTYWLDLPGGNPAVCNPVTAPSFCTPAALENLHGTHTILAGEGLGPTNGNRVRVFTADGLPTAVDFPAYQGGAWGTNVAAADLGGTDGCEAEADEILTGPGPGDIFGPHVRAFLRDGAPVPGLSYFAYGTLRFGVNVAGLGLDPDAPAELFTGPGPGSVFGPHGRGWNFDDAQVNPLPGLNFFAYATLRYGVNVHGGDFDSDEIDELLTGPGPGTAFFPQVRGWTYTGAAVASLPVNFMAFQSSQYGVNVAAGSVDPEPNAEIAAAIGPGPTHTPDIRGFDLEPTLGPLPGFAITANPSTHYGGRVGLGEVTGDGAVDLLTGEGRDPASPAIIRTFQYQSSQLSPRSIFTAFSGTYGVNVSGASLDR